MFSMRICSRDGCKRKALFRRETCFTHLTDRDNYIEEITAFFQAENVYIGLELSGITLKEFDLVGKEFWFCNLSHIHLADIRMRSVKIRLSFFDFSTFEDCRFTELDARLSAFAGSIMTDCVFYDSDIPRCNFIGIRGENTLFEGLDLYDCRFTNTFLEQSKFKDCNLKRVPFTGSKLIKVDFIASNVEEASFANVERQE